MRKVIGNVVCKENTGFAPQRFISENSHQMKIMQQYLEDNNEDGMFVFLDLEKAFDRVSWDYMKKAVARLGFGPDFQKWIDILYDDTDPPTRRIRVSGKEGSEFELKCGTAQGCPLSPLLYLCVMEAFTRTVKAEGKVKGMKIRGATYKLSQFADDTVLLLRTFGSIDEVWKILATFEKATGQRVNTTETEGLLLGNMRDSAAAPGWIKWCKDGDYIISLGVPFGNDFDNSQQELGFWRKIYHTTKSIMARWSAIFRLTLRGRVLIANAMVYSRFRYWTQVMMMPEEIIDWLEEDIHELIWRNDPVFVSGQEGQTDKAKRKTKETTAKLAWRKGGIGMLMWREHLKSLRRLWVRRYMDPGTGDWKNILDAWTCKGHTLGRGVMLGNGDTPELPNKFWEQTFADFYTMKFRRKEGDYEDAHEAAEEPIWESHQHQVPEMEDQDLWEDGMGIRQVKDLVNRETEKVYRGAHWDRWAAAGQGGLAAFGGQREMDKQRRKITNTVAVNLQLLRTTTTPPQWAKDEIVAYNTEEGRPMYCRIISTDNVRRLRRVRLTAQGRPMDCTEIIKTSREGARNERGDKVEGPVIWKVRMDDEGRITGIAGITFPRTEHYRSEMETGELMTIKGMTAKKITRDQVDKTTKRPTCEREGRWPVELRLRPGETIKWSEVWETFKIGLATPVDFGTRFRMIPGDLATCSKRGEPGGCRLGCGCPTEKHIHIIECARLQPLWKKLTRILEAARGRPFGRLSQAIVLGRTTKHGTVEKGSTALFSMLLKIINIEWFMVIHKNQMFDYAKVWKIFWTRAQRQWNETARDKEYELRNIHQRGSKTKSTWIGISRQLRPIGKIDQHTFIVTCSIDWAANETY